jgi:hypothetical protein
MTDHRSERIETAKTAAAVLCLLEGASVPLEELLGGLATAEQLEEIAQPLREGDRTRRARTLAAYLGPLAVQLDGWSLR